MDNKETERAKIEEITKQGIIEAGLDRTGLDKEVVASVLCAEVLKRLGGIHLGLCSYPETQRAADADWLFQLANDLIEENEKLRRKLNETLFEMLRTSIGLGTQNYRVMY